MPRLNIDSDEMIEEAPRRAPRARARAKKAAPAQDRLSSRALFFRRLRRSLRPGLWLLGALVVVVVIVKLVSSIVSAPEIKAASAPRGSGVASLGAALGLRISDVQISGAKETDMTLLRQAIGVREGEPTFGFSLDAVRQRIEQLGPVQTATVERELPGTLVVSITERNAFAIWQVGGTDGRPPSFELIDKQGNVITDQNAIAAKRREPWLLLLVGADAPQNAQSLMDELQGAPSVLAHVVAAERVDGLRWNLVLKDKTVVKLPDVGEAEAIDQLAGLQTSMQLLDRPVEAIDLRMPGRLVVKPYPVAKPDSGKSRHT
ncbi:MAG TPA: cell division protein FtsQ/DivIB [Acidocella sp.]|jgi:cell division protein FtsQ|uniref:cell division protein FtsQ/DivIB n=1 Tax=Acidocella sp. TaxID=50710 RepID=UPI002C1237E3|nr:cell division protein FtsQ/DivIB [Acidocella sp.]HVE23449.1 cell division protein FtsQ/DivIB [Acidocella sp.]